MWISSTPPSSVGVRKASISASAISRAWAYVGASEKPSHWAAISIRRNVENAIALRPAR